MIIVTKTLRKASITKILSFETGIDLQTNISIGALLVESNILLGVLPVWMVVLHGLLRAKK